MADISQIKLPNLSTYNIKDVTARQMIQDLPTPMVFKGTLGIDGTISSLPSPSAANNGFTYKVITDGTYAGQSAKVGDIFISNGSQWLLIPSGDEPSGTVTSVAVKMNGIIKGTVTSSGTIDLGEVVAGHVATDNEIDGILNSSGTVDPGEVIAWRAATNDEIDEILNS